MNFAKKQKIIVGILTLIFVFQGSKIQAQIPVMQVTETYVTKVAPGEKIPIAVSLKNFGSKKRVDVTVSYSIKDENSKTFYSETETVAVETTASFIKELLVPIGTKSGTYRVYTDLQYENQIVPAVSQFYFTVEQRWFGLFWSDFVKYGFFTVVFSLFLLGLFHLLFEYNSRRRINVHDYSDVPKKTRVYYEIISDVIKQMRVQSGNDALSIAADIPDLKIDIETGKVLRITKSPSKILALLVLRYETLLGHRVLLSARGSKKSEAQSGISKESVDLFSQS